MNRIVRMFILIMIIISFWVLYRFGFQKPPNRITGVDLQEVHCVSDNDNVCYQLDEDDLLFWKSLEFSLAKDEYPGETPDYKAYLFNEDVRYTVLYNENSKFVFFCFAPDIKYGWFNSPSPGGWTQPLYVTSATKTLLQLIKYEK